MEMRSKLKSKLGETDGIDQCALLMDAQIWLRKEECALDMGQSATSAAATDVQIKSSTEEYA